MLFRSLRPHWLVDIFQGSCVVSIKTSKPVFFITRALLFGVKRFYSLARCSKQARVFPDWGVNETVEDTAHSSGGMWHVHEAEMEQRRIVSTHEILHKSGVLLLSVVADLSLQPLA